MKVISNTPFFGRFLGATKTVSIVEMPKRNEKYQLLYLTLFCQKEQKTVVAWLCTGGEVKQCQSSNSSLVLFSSKQATNQEKLFCICEMSSFSARYMEAIVLFTL